MRRNLWILAAVCFVTPKEALAIPSFSAQTNQPCSACHVGSFGPQLKPYGRDFKLGGYTSSDRPDDNIVDNWYERFTTSVWTSLTHTNKDMPPASGTKGYGNNSNFSFDQGAVYFGGRITPSIGAIQEITYDGSTRAFTWDAMDLRYSHDGEFLGEDSTYGVVLGNQLGNTSPWNSTPPNAFPYNSSRVASGPAAGNLFDDSLNSQIIGPGAFMLWNDLVYADASVYFPLSFNADQAISSLPQGNNKYVAPIPYWHVALQKTFDHHEQYAQVGTFGASADYQPANDQTTGLRNHSTDIGFEANYQYMHDLHNMLSAHATYIHENQGLEASQALGNSLHSSNTLDKFAIDATYTIDDTWVPSVQYFATTGSSDPLLYSSGNGFTNNSPNSAGYTIDLAYVPFGKPDSPVYWGNARVALQYTAYTEFNGTSHNASDNNVLFVNFIADIAPFAAIFGDSTPSK